MSAAEASGGSRQVAVVGISGGDLDGVSAGARRAVAGATLLVGGQRLLDTVAPVARRDSRRVVLGELGPALDAVATAAAEGGAVCVLASGDPGFFGIVRSLASRLGSKALAVHPAPSSVALAFARLGLPWDDATVVSAHGRPIDDASRHAARSPKVAVLTSPEAPPSELGRCLSSLGASHEHAAVCSRLGGPDEHVTITDIAGLAAGAWEPLAVVVLWSGTGLATRASIAWGLPARTYAHRPGMITRAEVRSAVLGLLALPGPGVGGVVWDIGAGSGSIAIECARLAPWLEVVAVDNDEAAAGMIIGNARSHEVPVRVVAGAAPAALVGLPDPDRVFVGGGGLAVLDAARRRLAPDGVIVATHAAMDRAAAAASLLGNLSSITVNQGRRLPDGGWRLEGTNPVFLTWGGAPSP